MGAAGGELGGGGVAGAGQNGHPGSFNSGFGTESERATSRTRWRDLRDAQRRRSARATAAGRSKAPASKIRAEHSEREGEKGSASVLSTSRSSWAVNLSRRSGGVAARREPELRAHQWRRLGFARTGAAAAVRWGSKGFQGGAGALNRGRLGALGVHAKKAAPARAAPGLEGVPTRHEEGDARQAGPACRRQRGGRLSGLGEVDGPAGEEVWAGLGCGKEERERKRDLGWAKRKKGKRRWVLHFLL